MRRLPAILIGKRRGHFAWLVANGVAQAGVAVGMALLIQRGFDELVLAATPPPVSNALLFGAGLLGVALLGALLTWRAHIDAEKLGQSYVHAVRMKLFRHVARIGSEGVRQMSRGAVMLRFVGDLTALRNWVSLGLARLTVSGLASVLAILALSAVEPVIAVAVAIATLIAATLALVIGPRLRVSTREVRRQRGRLAAVLNDRVSRIGVVEAFGQERVEQRRFGRLSRSLRRSLIVRARTVGVLRALSEVSAAIASLCALVAGAVQVGMGLATPGAVVAAMAVAGILAPRLRELGRVYEYWNAALVARQKQEELLRLKPLGRPKKASAKKPLEGGSGALQLIGASRDGQLRSIDLDIEAGARVCIVGSNGAGKSTLLRLIGGIVQPHQGAVLLDQQDIHRCHWEDVRNAFAMVSPDLPLLRGSLRLNLTYGARGVTDDVVKKVIESCGLNALIKRLGNGLDVRISENGEGLSTGERARIALARALLVQPRVLLLDEAGANLDGPAAQALNRIKREFEGTVIYTTHARDCLTSADRIIHLDKGRIVAQGAPTELLRSGTRTDALFPPLLRLA